MDIVNLNTFELLYLEINRYDDPGSLIEEPAEYAVVSFGDRTMQPPLNARPWFSAGNFGEFQDNGKIDLLIHDYPSRYEKGSP